MREGCPLGAHPLHRLHVVSPTQAKAFIVLDSEASDVLLKPLNRLELPHVVV